ncbi:gamma carbonic anhydrase family protein [Rhodococcus gordoniae]
MKYQLGEHVPDTGVALWIAESATIVGRVQLGSGVSVFYGAVLRGDTEDIAVGAGTNIQDGCVLHSDPGSRLSVGEAVSVGHRAVLHGCTVGDHVLIGMGAVILNGATIGEGSLVAANAVVPEGITIPPHSLVAGVPAKVRRTLTADERQAIVDNARNYENTAREHAAAQSV